MLGMFKWLKEQVETFFFLDSIKDLEIFCCFGGNKNWQTSGTDIW